MTHPTYYAKADLHLSRRPFTKLSAGERLAMSEDSPTAPLDPWLQMEVAVLRKEPDHKEAFNPDQALSVEEVVQAYTMGAAYQIRGDELFGSIEVGKRADMVVLSQNIFEVKPEELHETKAILTMMNGKVVHEASIDWDTPVERFQFDACGSEGPQGKHDH